MTGGVHRIVAGQPIGRDSVILEVHGILVDRPTRYSVQIDEDLHVDLPPVSTSERESTRHPWQYLNHSCDPNAALAGRRLIALRSIRKTEEITFDYNTTEFEMATPFACQCGRCDGAMIRGFKFLSQERQRELAPRLAGHLRRRLGERGAF
jgi:hypothetical protein